MQEIECSILKECLLNKDFYSKAKTILEPSIFENNANAEIYKIINSYYDTYSEMPNLRDLVLKCQDVPNQEVRKQIQESLIDIKNSERAKPEFILDQTLKYTKDQIYTQGLLAGSDYLQSKNPKDIEKSKELIEKSQKLTLDDDLGYSFDDFESRIKEYLNPDQGLLYKRFKTLNKQLGDGILKGTLNLFMAPTGVGKSLMMSTSIVDFIIQGKNCLLISMEMSATQFYKRIDVDFLDVAYKTIKEVQDNGKNLTERFKELSKNAGKLYIKCYAPGEFSANMLDSLLDMYKSHGLEFDCVFLDYLGIMKSDRVPFNVGLYYYGKSITEEVRAVAVRRNLIIFSANQLNKSATNDTKADLSASSDSGGIAMTADMIIFLLQNQEMKEQNKLTLKFTKNRYSGLTNSVQMNVDYTKMRVVDEVIVSSESEQNEIEKQALEMMSNMDLETIQNSITNQQARNNINFWEDVEALK